MPFYPGAGAGGHCIPKDPRFLLESAKKFGTELNTLQKALVSNADIPKYITNEVITILEQKNLQKSVIICGLSYKPDIEDMRDSPGFKIFSNFIERGIRVAAYDPHYSEE